MKADRYIALAEVARPHGVRGELRLKIYNPDSEVLLRRPAVRLVTADGQTRAATLSSVRRVPGALLVRIEGVTSREDAERLRAARIEVQRAELDAIEAEDEHYICDLQGCRVMLAGSELGVVSDVASYPTCDALIVDCEGDKTRTLEVPLHAEYVASIDVDAKLIELNTIAGLE